MKNVFLFLLFLSLIQCTTSTTNKIEKKEYVITAVQKGAYNFQRDYSSLISRNDSIYNYLFEMKIKNNGNEILRFVTFSCSIIDNVVLDSKEIFLCVNNCAKNSMQIIELKPLEELIFPIILQTNQKNAYNHLKIGFVLIQPSKNINNFKEELYMKKKNFENIVWTSIIQLHPASGTPYELR